MKTNDIRKAISTIVNTGTKLNVYIEDINKMERPCFFSELIMSDKEFISENRMLKTYRFDLMYFPSDANTSCNNEVQNMLDEVDELFNDYGKRVLKVLDRVLTISKTNSRITQNVGHYFIDLEFYDNYGTKYLYEKMNNLELEI